MTTQTWYPIFESGQVLTSRHLNDLGRYLEQQDRLSRSLLTGIGVVCGLEPSFDESTNTLTVSGGVAVTSEGYLITLGTTELTHQAKFAVEPPPADTAEQTPEAEPYPFFLNDTEAPRTLWELLKAGESPADGSTPTALTSAFVADKVVLLYLERARVGLKSCDVNSCADKGSEMRFTLRKLLVSRQDAEEILEKEGEYTDRPVHRHAHPRYGLARLEIPKINPSGYGIGSFPELVGRIREIVRQITPALENQLELSWRAFEPLLRPVYTDEMFPNGPFPDRPFGRLVSLGLEKTDTVQYLYDGLHDAVRAYNEFLNASLVYDAECCPNPERFPRHVLLGMPGPPAEAFAPRAGDAIKPLAADSGYGPQERPVRYRHYFIPSPALLGGDSALRRVQSLHYRLYLLAYRFNAAGRSGEEVRVTPSRHGDSPLSRRALPFYYDFVPGDDLHRNWSYDLTTAGLLGEVPAYSLLAGSTHPHLERRDGQDFCRVEGIVGNSLRTVVAELAILKRRLGLTFAVQPVYLGLGSEKDEKIAEYDARARSLAAAAMKPYLSCRLGELNVLFLGLMSSLYRQLERALKLLVNLPSEDVAGKDETDDQPGVKWAGFIVGKRRFAGSAAEELTKPGVARSGRYVPGTLTKELTESEEPKRSVGALYQSIASADTGDLFDRYQSEAAALELDDDTDQPPLYQAVSLIDKIEGVLGQSTAGSLSEFDSDSFTVRYAAMKDAYAAYLEAVGKRDYSGIRAVDEGNAELGGIYAAVVSDDSDSKYSSFTRLMKERMLEIFESLRLENYAASHPGLEHRCGVERGGTLVVCYMHRDFLTKVLGVSIGSGGRLPSTTGTTLRGTAPLDDFIVVADFCLPYRCCDADCELQLLSVKDGGMIAQPDNPTVVQPDDPTIVWPIDPVIVRPIDPTIVQPTDPTIRRRVDPNEGMIRGAIIAEDRDDAAGGSARPLKDARLVVTDASRNERPVELLNGGVVFRAEPGKYTFRARAPGRAQRQKTIQLAAGTNPALIIELPPGE